jgi:histidinol-phosphate phosphatase family protein
VNPLPSAVFLDRDDTIIRDAEYISRPEQVELLPGAAEAVGRINSALVPVIVITNQSGIDRGYFTEADYLAVKQRLDEQLSAHGAHIDATYYCPHLPEQRCECRKPGRLLFEQAAAEHGIDLSRALYIGNRYGDIEPGLKFGGRAVLIPTSWTPPEEIDLAKKNARVARSLSEALDWYLCTN